MPDIAVAGLALTFLAVLVIMFIVWSERRLRRGQADEPRSPLLAPVCTMCLRPEDEPTINWQNEPRFCARCHKATTCYRALVRGPVPEMRQ